MANTNPALDKLKEMVAKAGNNQHEVAEALNISDAYLSDILKGKRGISDNMAEKLGFNRETVFIPMINFTGKGDEIGAFLRSRETTKS